MEREENETRRKEAKLKRKKITMKFGREKTGMKIEKKQKDN